MSKLGEEYKYSNGYKFIGFRDKDDQGCILSQCPGSLISISIQNVHNQIFMRMSRPQALALAGTIVEMTKIDA
jgi:hypothetical protein